MGSIPGQGTKILQAAQCGQKKKKRRRTYWPFQLDKMKWVSSQGRISFLDMKLRVAALQAGGGVVAGGHPEGCSIGYEFELMILKISFQV